MSEKLNIIITAQDKFSGAFGKLRSSLPSLKTLAIGAGAAFAGTGTALLAMAKSTATSYDAVRKFSDQLGVSTEFLSKYSMAAEFSGIKQETFNKSIQMLQVRIGEAARDIGQGKDAIEALGVQIYDSNKQLKTSEQILPELADAFHNMANATERAEAASKIFGQRGMAMLQMFKDGSEGLERMTAEAEKFGLVISEKAANNAAAFNDMLTRVTGSFKGVKNAISEQLMPALTGLGNKFASFVADNRDKIVQFAESFLIATANMAEKGAYGVAVLVDAWRGLHMVWEVLKIGFAEFSIALNEGINFLVEKFTWLLEKVNFRGIFDNDIAMLKNFQDHTQDAITAIEQVSATAMQNLEGLVAQGMATDKVDEYTEKIKQALAEIQAAGIAAAGGTVGEEGAEGAGQGIGPFSNANVIATEENIERLREMFNEYTMSEMERLNLWYCQQQELYAGHQEALFMLDEIYNKKRTKLIDKQNKTDTKNKKKQDKDEIKWTGETYTALNSMALMFGEKGVIISKAVNTAQAIMSTYTGAANALRDLPFPANLKAAAIVIATGIGSFLPNIKGQSFSVAHGGMDYVPKEQTYLLDKGERVLSPNQNKELMDFIRSEGGASVNVEEGGIVIQIQENPDDIDYIQFAEDKLIPAFRLLAGYGIKI